MFGRNDGYILLTKDRGEMLPFSLERCGDNQAIVVLSWDNGETWQIQHQVELPKPQNCHGMSGAGVICGDSIIFPLGAGTGNPEMNKWRHIGALARLRLLPNKDGTFTSEYEHMYRVLADNGDNSVPFSSETIYIEKTDKSGYVSFTRNQQGPPYRREYDRDHALLPNSSAAELKAFVTKTSTPGAMGRC